MAEGVVQVVVVGAAFVDESGLMELLGRSKGGGRVLLPKTPFLVTGSGLSPPQREFLLGILSAIPTPSVSSVAKARNTKN